MKFPKEVFRPPSSGHFSSGQQTIWSRTCWSWRQYLYFTWGLQTTRSCFGKYPIACFHVNPACWWLKGLPGEKRTRNPIYELLAWTTPYAENKEGSRWWTYTYLFLLLNFNYFSYLYNPICFILIFISLSLFQPRPLNSYVSSGLPKR